MKPWKSQNPAGQGRGGCGFNGATAMKPWKSKSLIYAMVAKNETIATLPGGWDLAHAIRLGIKLFAELGANSQALSGSHVDSPCSCRAIFESAPVAMLQSPKNALQWGHGDEAVEEPAGRDGFSPGPWRFNGATAMKPWKRPSLCENVVSTISLQWGHGDEAVEEVRSGNSRPSADSASMGPRR